MTWRKVDAMCAGRLALTDDRHFSIMAQSAGGNHSERVCAHTRFLQVKHARLVRFSFLSSLSSLSSSVSSNDLSALSSSASASDIAGLRALSVFEARKEAEERGLNGSLGKRVASSRVQRSKLL
jgi:hypothetical protein